MSTNYIINRDATRFGGNQAHYLQRRDAAIEEGLALIKGGVVDKELFFRLLSLYADRRKAIAVENRTEDAQYFSLKRIDVVGMIETTPIFGVYDEFREKMFSLFETTLNGTGVKEDKHLDRSCYFEIESISDKDIEEREWKDVMPLKKRSNDDSKVIELHKRREKIQQIEMSNPIYAPNAKNLKEFNEILKKLKMSYPFFYNHLKMAEILIAVSDLYKSASLPAYNTVFYAKMRIEINGKKYALTEYCAPTVQSDPIKRMRDYRVVMIHQDRFLTEDMLKEIAVVFEKAIRTDRSKLEELKDQVALIRYLFAHAMPYARGSAAIGEWIEKTIYQFHSYECTHRPTTLADLEALTSLWSTFRKERYDQTIILKPLDQGEKK